MKLVTVWNHKLACTIIWSVDKGKTGQEGVTRGTRKKKLNWYSLGRKKRMGEGHENGDA